MSPHDWKFHCAVLNVPEHASAREIKDTYRKLAQRFHPDHNGDTQQAKEKFQRISASYHYLSKNMNSRPVFQTAESFPPPQPQPAYMRERAGGGGQGDPLGLWAAKLNKYFMFKMATFSLGFLWKKQIHAPLLIGGSLILGTFAIGTIFQKVNVTEPVTAELPKLTNLEVTPNTKVDSYGRFKGRCEYASFLNDRLLARSINDLSENDCNLGCYSWVEKYKENDAGCDWEGKNIVQHIGAPNDRLPASPRPHTATKEAEGVLPTFYFNRVPEEDGKIPTEWKETRVGEELVIETPYVPTVWVEDKKLVLAKPGLHSNHVILTPIRPGTTGVFFTDPDNLRARKIVYDIK